MAALLLIGCGGGGGGGDDNNGGGGSDLRLDRLDLYEAQRIRVLGDPEAGIEGLEPTMQSGMPTTGLVTYTGFASLLVETLPQSSVLAGDLRLEAAFDTATLAGSMDSFFGTDAEGNLQNYSGTIEVSDGTIGGADPAGWSANYVGALTNGAQTIALDGDIEGQFLGEAGQAMTGSDLDAEIVVGTSQSAGILIVVAEQ